MKKENFVAELESIVERLKLIDSQTNWQPVEPEWWLDMVNLQRQCYDLLRKHGAEKIDTN